MIHPYITQFIYVLLSTVSLCPLLFSHAHTHFLHVYFLGGQQEEVSHTNNLASLSHTHTKLILPSRMRAGTGTGLKYQTDRRVSISLLYTCTHTQTLTHLLLPSSRRSSSTGHHEEISHTDTLACRSLRTHRPVCGPWPIVKQREYCRVSCI